MTLPLSLAVLRLLADVVEKHAGIRHSDADLDFFASKVGERASDAGFESLLDYYYMLRYDDPKGAELDQLIDVMVVGETYFFREAGPLGTLVDTLGETAARGGRLRIWSAACATGEEPVTLAILLARKGLLDAVDIVASDISQRAVDRARKGTYGVTAHRAVPTGVDPWIRVEGGRAIVDEQLRAGIDWRCVNLTDESSVSRLGSFDAIVCQNVLLYFADETARKVADNLVGALHPGGRLLVGTCESLMRFGSTLECEERNGAFFYKRRAA